MAAHASANPASATERRRALALLVDNAAPERRHLWIALAGLVAAALLEALGPILAKYFIDHFLLPRAGELVTIAALLGGAFWLTRKR